MMGSNIFYLQKKREEVLKTIAPICKAFNISEYDYIVKETGQTECLRLYDTYIGCSYNSIEATVEELIGYIFVKIYCRNRSIGAFKTQTLNCIRQFWLDEQAIKNNYAEKLQQEEVNDNE